MCYRDGCVFLKSVNTGSTVLYPIDFLTSFQVFWTQNWQNWIDILCFPLRCEVAGHTWSSWNNDEQNKRSQNTKQSGAETTEVSTQVITKNTSVPLHSHYVITDHAIMAQSWRQWNKKFFTVCGHELISKGFLLPRVAPFKYLFFSTWVPFLLSFTIINTILFFIFTRLQLFNYLSPRELFPPAQYGASTFSTFRKNFFQR